jgi:hypothetical protein
MKYICPKCDSEFEFVPTDSWDAALRGNFNCINNECKLRMRIRNEEITGWNIQLGKFNIESWWFWGPIGERRLKIFYGSNSNDYKVMKYISPKYLTEQRIDKLLLLT